MTLSRVLGALLRISIATAMVALSAASAARASPTIADLGASVLPVAVNAHQQVLSYNGSVWSNGAVTTPQAPSSNPTAQFDPASDQYGTQINDSGVVVGQAITVGGGGETILPAYWNTASSSFTVLSLSGLTVNSQPATGGLFEAVDAAGDAVGVVYNSSGSADDVSANTAGLFVAGNDAMPTGASHVLASIDGTAIHSLDGVSAGYEDANESESDTHPEVLIDRQNQTATTTNLYAGEQGPIGFADNGTLSGTAGAGGTPTVRTASGSETSLSEPTGESGPATDVNAGGTAVGFVYTESGPAVKTGLIWSSTGTDSGLLSQVSNPGAWTQLQPEAINDEGYIVGTGQLNGVEHGFLISTPSVVPPVVNSTGDTPAAGPASGSCDTGHTVATALGQKVPECTLRAAIQTVNAIGTSGQRITFAIPGTAPGAIQLGSLLPAVTAAGTVIDGESQPSGPVQILGPGESSAAPSGAAGCLDVQAADVTIEGVDLGNCQVGIELQSPGGDDVQDDVVGLALNGETPTPCNYGVWNSNSPDNTIGGTAVADRNVFSADGTGVLIGGSGSTGDKVQGNLIGTDSSGSAFVPDTYGVEVLDASDDTIGAAGIAVASAGKPPGNVIDAAAGKAHFAVAVLGVSARATDDVVGGNLVGTDASGSRIDLSGTTNLGPGLGVVLAGFVSGDTVGDGNVIAGATGAEVLVDSVHASRNTISGNQVGSSRSGKVALPSTSARGILVAGAHATVIANNAVTGQESGISIQGHPAGLPAPAGGTVSGTGGGSGITNASISGNVVGPLPGGKRRPNGAQQEGIFDSGGTADVIGPNNQVSWNRIGVILTHVTVADLKGNLIGTNRAGTVALPDGLGMLINQSKGVYVGVVGHPDTISGNTDNLVIQDSDHVRVRAELVGTTKLGNAALAPFSGKLPWGDLIGKTISLGGGSNAVTLNGRVGIAILGGGSPTQPILIGGSKPGDGVVVSGIKGSTANAIELQGPALLIRDKIGVGQNGTSAVPNGGTGVLVSDDDASDNGSDSTIARSTIAHNNAGVEVKHADKVRVLESLVFDNQKGGINANDGTFGNAPFPPTLLSASDVSLTRGGKKFVGIRVVAHVDVPGSQQSDIEFFATPTCQAGGAGKRFLGTVTLSGDQHKIRVLIRALLAVGTAITATQSTTGNGTSRFSNCALLAPAT